MRDVANAYYENCALGGIGFIRPDFSRGEKLIDFQNVLFAAKALEDNGKIEILDLHFESQTGQNLMDSIRFKRIE